MTVVVAYSSDEYGQAALLAATHEAKLRQESLIVVNATRGESFVDPGFASTEELTAVKGELSALGLEVNVRHEVVPDIAELVVTAADDAHASLIVVGTRHRSPVGKALMGSVAQRIILDANCPVLSVKPN